MSTGSSRDHEREKDLYRENSYRQAFTFPLVFLNLNDAHRVSNGTDHINVVLNDIRRGSDGIDHANEERGRI
jgi:hypothetical protein